MTKLQLINGIEAITNELKKVEESELTSCITHETISQMIDLFDEFEEEYINADYDSFCDTYQPKKDILNRHFPCIDLLVNLSIQPKESELTKHD